jgi:glucosyl-dolichyl phosphate glucuronosyltransferase
MSAKGKKRPKLISAIVCTYDRYDVLPDSLVSLNQQSLPKSDYEVIVVDNSSDREAQRSFWKRSQSRFPVTVELQPVPGLSKARNTGLRTATAPLVAFADDDAVVSSNWLESLVRLFDDEPSAGIGGGPVVPIWPDAAPKWLHDWLSGFFTIVDRGAARRRLGDDEWLAGTNIAFRRDLLLDAGGFDETLGRRGSKLLSNEELEVSRRIQEAGFGAFYEPAALVYHKIHEARVNQAWLRRRVAWQIISDAILPAGNSQCDRQRCWDTIADYALRVPPEMRGLRGLFLDTDDADTLNRQCEAIGALMRLMMFDGQDPDRPTNK